MKQMKFSRRSGVIGGLFSLLCTGFRADKANATQSSTTNVPWSEVAKLARQFVAAESPPTVWPFEHASVSVMQASDRKVLVHYMPFYQLSCDNVDPAIDTWSKFVARQGFNGKYNKIGGYMRARHLSPAPWPSTYWRQINAAIDILRAQAAGVDGFGVDISALGASDDPGASQIVILCEAAAAVAPGFVIALEPGMVALKNVTASQLANELAFFASQPSIARLSGTGLLVIPFAAELRPVGFWRAVISQLESSGQNVAFLPDFLNLVKNAAAFAPISYGETLWCTRDPEDAESPYLIQAEQNNAAKLSAWMSPVSPQDIRPKSSFFFESLNTKLFRILWRQAIQGTAKYVHVITWNDYSESTEVQPSSGTQFLFYDLMAYYAHWFKLGQAPKITGDAIYYCHRTQIYVDGEGPQFQETPFQLKGKTPIQNDVEVIVMLKEPAVIEIEVGGLKTWRQAQTGMSVFRQQAQPGFPSFSIRRNGEIVVQKTSDWEIQSSPTVVNPVYFGGSSNRAFVSGTTASM